MYIKQRQNPLTECPESEVEDALRAIVDHFGEDWLTKTNGEHVLQKLWTRKDALSTNELFTFGTALITANQIDDKWLKKQLGFVKSKDINNQKGAIFEILAVQYMSGQQIVIPAPINQNGYDMDIVLADSRTCRISVKCYSESVHEKLFRKKSEITQKKVIALATQRNVNVQVIVTAKEYPSEAEWQLLYSGLHHAFSTYNGYHLNQNVNSVWNIAIMPLVLDAELLMPGFTSFTFICISPFHQNEQDNFLSKLETAIGNLNKHVERGEKVPIILMRLPPTASVETLKEWTEEMLKKTDSSADMVIFLQPTPSADSNFTENFIAYYAAVALSPRLKESHGITLKFEVPVGVVVSQPTQLQLRYGVQKEALQGSYLYQAGEHYVSGRQTPTGYEGNIHRKGPGIYSYLVMPINGERIVLSGRWGEELTLIGG